jgi:hypothetical protein
MTMKKTAPKLSLAVVEDLTNKGWTQREIAQLYGVTRQYVSWIKRTYGGRKTAKELVFEHFPLSGHDKFVQTSPYRLMRMHGDYIASGGVGMPEDKLSRLRSWYKMLREKNVVLEYDPRLLPEPGVSNRGGFTYRPRLPDDKDLLIRENEYTNLTEEGKRIWRLPEVEP